MPAHKVKFDICGSNYTVSTSDSEEHIMGIAKCLDDDMKKLMSSTPSISITTSAVITAMTYLEERIKTSLSVDNMRGQIQSYLEDAANAKLHALEYKQEAEKLQRNLRDCGEKLEKLEKDMLQVEAARQMLEKRLINRARTQTAGESTMQMLPQVVDTPNVNQDGHLQTLGEGVADNCPGQLSLEEL